MAPSGNASLKGCATTTTWMSVERVDTISTKELLKTCFTALPVGIFVNIVFEASFTTGQTKKSRKTINKSKQTNFLKNHEQQSTVSTLCPTVFLSLRRIRKKCCTTRKYQQWIANHDDHGRGNSGQSSTQSFDITVEGGSAREVNSDQMVR